MTEGSGTELKCARCNYSTLVWDHDGHASVCPECSLDALLPAPEADELMANRLHADGTFRRAVTADSATDAILAPAGATDPDHITHIDGQPVVETPSLADLYDEQVVETVTAPTAPLFDQLETIEMIPGNDHDPTATAVTPDYEGSLSVNIDAETDGDLIDALRTATEEARRNAVDRLHEEHVTASVDGLYARSDGDADEDEE